MDKPTKKPQPFPWRVTVPQSPPERLQVAAHLAEILADPSIQYDTVARVFATALYTLSGRELERFGVGLIKLLGANNGFVDGTTTGRTGFQVGRSDCNTERSTQIVDASRRQVTETDQRPETDVDEIPW